MDYAGAPDPSALHPLWKHWLAHGREVAPTDRDIYVWELEQVRLKKRLREIESASSKMRSEEMAQRERGQPQDANPMAELMSQLVNDRDVGSITRRNEPRQETSQVDKDFLDKATSQYTASAPKPGENLSFENGVQVIPKSHKPYSPDPSRLQSILSKNKKAGETATSKGSSGSSSVPSGAVWSPKTGSQNNSTDDL